MLYNSHTIRSKREVRPPDIREQGGPPPQPLQLPGTGLYIDFDNLYGAFLAHSATESRKDSKLTNLQKRLLPVLLEQFLKNVKTSIEYTFDLLYSKAFADYDKLPHKNFLNINVPVLLHNIGIKPYNPFISTGKHKNKNAADISLTLTVVEDLIIKRLDVKSVILFTGDIDFYPLISWLRENSGKRIYIMSFEDRLNSNYRKLMGEYIILVDEIFLNSVKELPGTLSDDEMNMFQTLDNASIIWLKEFIGNAFDDEVPEEWNRIMSSIAVGDKSEPDDECGEFISKMVSGLKNWLSRNLEASTGLIIKNWMPRWGLTISEIQANDCLRRAYYGGILEKEGIEMIIEQETDGIIMGTFRLKEEV